MPTPKIPTFKMPGMSLAQVPDKLPQSSLNPNTFDAQIANQGIRMILAKPLPNPRVRDVKGDDEDPGDNLVENGAIYYGHKEFTGSFGSNELQKRFNPTGLWDDELAVILVPTKYSDGTDLDVQYYDRIIVPDFTIRYGQRVEHSMTGVDRLHFPAVKVDVIMDSSDRQYREGVDFSVCGGEIRWLPGGSRPGFDPGFADPEPAFPDPLTQRPSPYGQPALSQPGKGQIYGVVYYCKAQFTVTTLPHQLRIGQTRPAPGQPNVQTRFTQLAICKKDFVPNDPNDRVGPKSSDEPEQGSVRGGS